MKPSLRLILPTLCLGVCLCGCAVVEVATVDQLNQQQLAPDTTAVAHIQARNWGWYLFKFIPLVSGNLDSPGYPQMPALFRHNVTVGKLVELITAKSRELGATMTTDLQSSDKSRWRPLTLVLWLNEVEVSANAVKPSPSAQAR